MDGHLIHRFHLSQISTFVSHSRMAPRMIVTDVQENSCILKLLRKKGIGGREARRE